MISFRGYLDQIQEAKKNKYEYSSAHVLIPDDLSASIIAWGEENISEEDLYKDPTEAGYAREGEPHITILYGLYTTKPREVRLIANDFKPFDIRLGEISIFKNEYFDVIKIEVKSKELYQLNEIFCSELKYNNIHPNYQPHATIAYVKKNRCKKLANNDFFNNKKFPVKEIVFSSKNGDKVKLPLRGRGKT